MSDAPTVSDLHADPSEQARATPEWLKRVDDFCADFGDRLNPILVKETRQALKSRQFVATFSVLLVAALAWTIIGSLSMMPRIYTSPSAATMLIGYYCVLAVPMLLVVPLAAYRSLENEIDDGTLELLSITVLSPWQIVLGKLASALLQMLLYFVALVPCVAYAYTLRGVDFPTILMMIGLLIVAGLALTVFGLFMSPIARSKSGRIGSLLLLMMGLLLAEFFLGLFVIGILLQELSPDRNVYVYGIILAGTVIPAACHLLLTATAAQLTPESENRSTQIRVSILVLTGLSLGAVYLADRMFGNDGFEFAFSICLIIALVWVFAGSMMCAETGVMTPRIRRELPSSFLGRMTLTWLTPGPFTGLVFASVVIAVTTAAIMMWFGSFESYRYSYTFGFHQRQLKNICFGFSAYVIGYLMLTYLVVRLLRRRNHPRVEIGVAAFATVAMLSALIPYSIGLQLNDFREYPYGISQITNWFWTILFTSEVERRMPLMHSLATIFAMCLLLIISKNRHVVMPRRTEMPLRVQQEIEEQRLSKENPSFAESSES